MKITVYTETWNQRKLENKFENKFEKIRFPIFLLRNILIKNDVLKICDFGISKLIQSFTNATKGIGTSAYMSPEMHNVDKNYDYKADIWWLIIKRKVKLWNPK